MASVLFGCLKNLRLCMTLCRVLVTKFAVRSTPYRLTEMPVRPILGMYRKIHMACAETHVKCSKESGCHGGRCSIQVRVLGLTPWTEDIRPGHHAVTSDRSGWRNGALCRPTL